VGFTWWWGWIRLLFLPEKIGASFDEKETKNEEAYAWTGSNSQWLFALGLCALLREG
jgi:hypothetical protein